MKRFNILWGILHGGSDIAADWVRGSSEHPGYGGRDDDVLPVLPERDDSIRGWMTEALVKSALSSSYARDILALDPLNTYSKDLHGPADRLFTTRPNIIWPVTWYNRPKLVVMTRRPSWSGVYLRSVTYKPVPAIDSGVDDLIDETLSFSYTPSDGSTRVISADVSDGKVTLPFDDGEITVRGLSYEYLADCMLAVTYKALPKESPYGILKERLRSDDLRESAGEFCIGLLRRHL